jgi:hypothetical protein
MGNEKEGSSPCKNPTGESTVTTYEIRVKGCMDEIFWSDWFGGMEVSIDLDREQTTLRGAIADQAELYGLLSRLRNKGLTLLSVQRVGLNENQD